MNKIFDLFKKGFLDKVAEKLNGSEAIDVASLFYRELNGLGCVDFDDLNDYRKKYFEYLLNHKVNVFNVGMAMLNTFAFESFCKNINLHIMYARSSIVLGLIVHDLSKFSNLEFFIYALKFFGDNFKDSDKEEFARAWQHHYQNNSHHYENYRAYTADGFYSLEMPIEYVFEMVADWGAMSIQNGTTLTDDVWMVEKLPLIAFHEKTAEYIRDILGGFFNMPYEVQKKSDHFYLVKTNQTKDEVLQVLRYAQRKGYESTSELSDAEIDTVLHEKNQSYEKHDNI